MRDEQHGGSRVPCQGKHCIRDDLPGPLVKIAGRFISEDQARPNDKRPGNRHPLLFAPGKSGWTVREPAFETNPL